MTTTKGKKVNKTSTLTIISLLLFGVFFSTNSLAKLNNVEKINTQEGYPYADLVRKSEQLNLIYTKSDNEVNCRVEISKNGQVWQGQKQVAKLKDFKNKPLRSCFSRLEAKKILASIY
jgi:hypothetical protein